MTLILTRTSWDGVIQVVDRLVSRLSNGAVSEYDDCANKVVVFAARDGLMTAAYTGLAYLNDRPTDQWMAEVLRNKPILPGPRGGPCTVSFDRIQNWPGIGQAVERLRVSLDAAIAQVPVAWRRDPFSIVVSGWQLYRSRPRTFGLSIDKAEGASTSSITRLPRHLGRRVYLTSAPDNQISSVEQLKANKAVLGVSANDAELAMVKAIRNVSARNARVGPTCTCVILPPPWIGWARVRLDSPMALFADVFPGPLEVPITYSPWVITEGQAIAPSMISGPTREFQIGPWLLRVEGTGAPVGPVTFVHFSQDRKPVPR